MYERNKSECKDKIERYEQQALKCNAMSNSKETTKLPDSCILCPRRRTLKFSIDITHTQNRTREKKRANSKEFQNLSNYVIKCSTQLCMCVVRLVSLPLLLTAKKFSAFRFILIIKRDK